MAKRTRRKSSAARRARQSARQAESLNRARGNTCPRNEALVLEHFAARGVPISEINPRENVLTFHAWKALGRSVRKGERGCKLTTWIPIEGKREQGRDESERSSDHDGESPRSGGKLRPKTTHVFHISQTHPIGEKDGADPLPLAPDDPRRDESDRAEPAPAGRVPEPPKPEPEPESVPEPASVRHTPALF